MLPSLALAAALLAATAPARPLCDDATPFELFAFDTQNGEAIFAFPSIGKLRLFTLDAGSETARLLPADPRDGGIGDRSAGSVGPGAPFALHPCGEGCLRAERWDGSQWLAFGEPLANAAGGTFASTYDRGGRPWVIAFQPMSTPGWVSARAAVFQAGRWQDRGVLSVRSLPTLGAAPASWRDDAVIAGTGLFSLAETPATWIAGLPSLSAGKEGQVLPLDATGAVFLAGDGAVYWSDDGGQRWSGSRWRPWGVDKVELWNYGADYSLDIPLGALAAGSLLPVAWFDRRPNRAGEIVLAELSRSGVWSPRARLPLAVEADTGAILELTHLLRSANGEWMLLSDCHAVGASGGFALRVARAGDVTPPRFVPIR